MLNGINRDATKEDVARATLRSVNKAIEHILMSKYMAIRTGAITEDEIDEHITKCIDKYDEKFKDMSLADLAFSGVKAMMEELEEKANG